MVLNYEKFDRIVDSDSDEDVCTEGASRLNSGVKATLLDVDLAEWGVSPGQTSSHCATMRAPPQASAALSGVAYHICSRCWQRGEVGAPPASPG